MTDPILAAGALCWRVTARGKLKVLLVFRTQRRDWSFPKGKLDPGETLPETAVREIAEETGLSIALGPPLGMVGYVQPLAGRDKQVFYWSAEISDAARANSTFTANDEIESLHWLTVDAARARLSYPHDIDILDRFAELYEQGRARTFAIIALRHGKAEPHGAKGNDADRVLTEHGVAQATSVAHGIAAYRPASLITSTAARCVATIAPTARVTGLDVTETEVISQDAYSGRGERVAKYVRKLVSRGETVVLCSHGPVLPQILEAAADATGGLRNVRLDRAAALATGEFAVLHVSVEHPESGLIAVEVHSPTV